MKILLNIYIGTSTINFLLPIVIENFEIKGKMRFDLTFFPKSPFLHTLSYSFVELPFFDLSIKLYNLLELTYIPYLKEWIYNSLKVIIFIIILFKIILEINFVKFGTTRKSYSFTSKNLWNNRYRIYFLRIIIKSKETNIQNNDIHEVRHIDVQKHSQEIEKSIKMGGFYIKITIFNFFQFLDYAGLLHVTILEAKKLDSDFMRSRHAFF